MAPILPTQSPTVSVNLNYRDYVEALFLRIAYAEGLTTIVGAGWVTRSGLIDAPGEVLGRASYFHSATKELVVRLDRTVCHLILSERSLVSRIAAASTADAERALTTLAAALPEVNSSDREAAIRLWWWAGSYPQAIARMLPSPPWSEIERNYIGTTHGQLAQLTDWESEPPSGGRLLLWHGDPGTGKTSAIRSLTGEWREWAEFQFITDPEEFLSNPSYLLATITDTRRGPAGPANRWRVVVLEDAGEFLAPDAKHLKGQALSRLLNVCDGVLGQAMRVLVLVTTNEPLARLHPALSRPGRCLSQISFERFDRAAIETWCAFHDVQPPNASPASLADLYAHLAGRPAARSAEADDRLCPRCRVGTFRMSAGANLIA